MSSTTHYRPSAPSHLSMNTSSSSPLFVASQKKKTMSITQTYYLAHKARAKLSSEAGRSDHNLRLLVGHANLLDSLMLELADAEREQESWFNQSVRGATKTEEKHIQWADSIVEDPEEDWQAEDADSDSDSDEDYDEEDDIEMADVVSLRRVPSATPAKPTVTIRIEQAYEEMEEDDLEEDYAQLELVRTPSHSSSPPELEHDSDSSDDESMPPSPPNTVLTFSEKDAKDEMQQEEDHHNSFYSEGFYLPPRNPARLVSAISVY